MNNNHDTNRDGATEQEAVQTFLNQSTEFKKMKEIGKLRGMESWGKLISRLERCSSFGEVMFETSQYDIADSDNIVVYNIGRNKMNAVLYTWGFFSNSASFAYYALHLRESIQAHLNNQQQNRLAS